MILQYLLYLWSKCFGFLHGYAIRNSVMHNTASVSPGCNIINCKMGRSSYIGNETWAVNAEIGSFCSIADRVYIGGAEHPMQWLSTSPVFQNVGHTSSKTKYARHDWNPYQKRITIGHDVWIGHGAVVCQGVTIGTGAVVGANAVVTKDVPPYAIVAGVPAKVIRYRFDSSTINLLLTSEWWKWSDEQLNKLGVYANNETEFVKYIEKIMSTKQVMGGVILPYKNYFNLTCVAGYSDNERRLAA